MADLYKEYMKFLRECKKKDLKVEDAPPKVQQAWLAVHQAASLDYWNKVANPRRQAAKDEREAAKKVARENRKNQQQ